MQIRDGLHVFGVSPEGQQRTDLLVALLRVPRGGGQEGDASLIRALAADLGLASGFDPLDCTMAAPRSEEHTSELQSLMRISYAVFCLKKKNIKDKITRVQKR